MAGTFLYDQARDDDVIYAPYVPPAPPAVTRAKVSTYDQLRVLDMRYAFLVCGAGAMPLENYTIVARNETAPLNAAVLSQSEVMRCHDAAWSEVIRRRFLGAEAGSAAHLGRGMLEIVHALKLELRPFVVVGLHQRVEAAEHQIVQTLMMQGFLDRAWDIHTTAVRLRRSERLSAVYANAVGAHACCNNALALGAGESRYNRDLQYANRDRYYKDLRSWIKELGTVGIASHLESLDGTDYVLELNKVRIVRRRAADVAIPARPDTTGGGNNNGGSQIVTTNIGGPIGSARTGAENEDGDKDDGASDATEVAPSVEPMILANDVMETIVRLEGAMEAFLGRIERLNQHIIQTQARDQLQTHANMTLIINLFQQLGVNMAVAQPPLPPQPEMGLLPPEGPPIHVLPLP